MRVAIQQDDQGRIAIESDASPEAVLRLLNDAHTMLYGQLVPTLDEYMDSMDRRDS